VLADTIVNVATIDLDVWQRDGIMCLSGRGWSGQSLKITDQGLEIEGEDSEQY
jgi:hypothetical protein